MKRFMVLCLISVLSVFFIACEEADQPADDDQPQQDEEKAKQFTVISGNAQITISGNECVAVKSAELNALSVKDADTTLCVQRIPQNKCWDSTKVTPDAEGNTPDQNFVWSAENNQLEAKAGLKDCKPLVVAGSTPAVAADQTAAGDKNPAATEGAGTVPASQQGGEAAATNPAATQQQGATPSADATPAQQQEGAAEAAPAAPQENAAPEAQGS